MINTHRHEHKIQSAASNGPPHWRSTEQASEKDICECEEPKGISEEAIIQETEGARGREQGATSFYY